jgi:hypothetical protein
VTARFNGVGPVRLSLTVNDDPSWRDRWDFSRHLWDDRHTDGLRVRLGGGDRTPFFHRDGQPLGYDGPGTPAAGGLTGLRPAGGPH